MKCCNFRVGAASDGVFSVESPCYCPWAKGESGSWSLAAAPLGFMQDPVPLPAAALLGCWRQKESEGELGKQLSLHLTPRISVL